MRNIIWRPHHWSPYLHWYTVQHSICIYIMIHNIFLFHMSASLSTSKDPSAYATGCLRLFLNRIQLLLPIQFGLGHWVFQPSDGDSGGHTDRFTWRDFMSLDPQIPELLEVCKAKVAETIVLPICINIYIIPYKSKTEVFLGFAQIPGVYTQNPRFSKTW